MMTDKRYIDDDGFLSRVLRLLSPVDAAQSVGQAAGTFSDIINNRGVTDEAVEQAGMTAGAFGSLAPRPRFPRTVAEPPQPMPRAVLGDILTPETRAYGRGYREGVGQQFDGPASYLDDPITARAHAEGFQHGSIRPDLVELRAQRGASMPARAPAQARTEVPPQGRQPLGPEPLDSAAGPAKRASQSSRLSVADKNDIVRRMAQGKAPDKFKTPAEKRYAADIQKQADAMGVPVKNMWDAIATGVRKRAWMAAPVAVDPALEGIDWDSAEFKRRLDSGEVY